MKYFRASQPIPGKGDAWVYYECTDEQKIVRQLTYIPATGEIDRVPDPIVKKLYKPEWLEPASEQDFISLWDKK